LHPFLRQFKVIALTHRTLGLDLVGKFHVEPDRQAGHFSPHLALFDIREFMYLSTCNRVEFFFRTVQPVDSAFVKRFLYRYYPQLEAAELEKAVENARTYEDKDAIRHIFHVTSSLDSLVIGEREIITQVRTAYERAHKHGMAGDFIRIAIQKAIETAKQVYTETEIATKPVSIVNLAYRKLLERHLTPEKSVLFIGAGQTVEAFAGNLKSFNFRSLKVFNRTSEKARTLASALNGTGHGLDELASEAGEFDIIVTCTGAQQAIIDAKTYAALQQRSPGKKTIVDLAIPSDIDPEVLQKFDVDYIAIEDLKEEAKLNLKGREKAIFHCEALVEKRLEEFEEAFRTRKLELAMNEIPRLMKEIKSNALQKTFSKDLQQLDPESRETLNKILDYLERKYISLPMKMAKQIVLDQDLKDRVID